MVAILVFSLGGGIAIYEGIEHLRHPRQLENVQWNYVVLILAMVFEAAALRVALKQFNATRCKRSFLWALRDSKDSPTVAVVVEDSAALVGLLIALFSVLLGQLTGWPYFDGIGSVLIGLLLMGLFVYFFFIVWGINATAWVASAGIIGIVVGFAARKMSRFLSRSGICTSRTALRLSRFPALPKKSCAGRVTRMRVKPGALQRPFGTVRRRSFPWTS